MAESFSEVSSSMEGFEGTEDGKKKSKFKAFKSFFGKKKKKEPEDASEGKLKPRFSSGSLKPVQEIQVKEHKPKNSMGTKAISHDSIFSLEPEPEKSPSKLHSSPEPQKIRPQKRSSISQTLPRATATDVPGALSGSVGHYEPIPPLRTRKLSVSPSVVRSEKVSRDLKTAFAGDKTLKISKMKSSHCSPTPRKSMSELSSDLDLSQSSQSSTQQPLGFTIPATSQGCLDSSAARHKIALNPRKQKRKKTISSFVKVKQEDQYSLLAPKEKATTKTKQAERKDQRRNESAGPPSQEQRYKTETQDKKTRDQALSTDAASSTGHSILGSQPRRRRRRAKNEWGIIERSLFRSTQEHNLGSKAESNEKLAGRELSFRKLFLEKQGTKQITTTEEVTTLQKMPSDKRHVKGEMADIDVEARRTLAPQPSPTDVAESMVSGSPPSCKEASSEGKKKNDRVALLPRIQISSTSQEEATVSRTAEVQRQMHPSQVHGEKEKASSLDLQKFQPKMELSLESKTYHKERRPRGGLQAFISSVSSTTAEDDVSMPRVYIPLKRWPNVGELSSDSKSTSEYESSSEVQLGPAPSFKPAWNPQDDDDVFFKSGNVGAELSKMQRQKALGYSSQLLRKPKSREVSVDPGSSSEEQRSSEEMTSVHSSQSLEEFEECSETRSFILDSVSKDPFAPRRHLEAFQESEEKEVSTESSSYVEKYHSSEDLSSSEEDQLPEHPKKAWAKFRDQQEVSLVPKSASKELSISSKPVHPIQTSPLLANSIIQQQSPISTNISVGQSRCVEPLSHTVKSWLSPQSEHQVFTDPEDIDVDWSIFMQSPSPRKASKHPMGYNVEKNIPSSPDIPSSPIMREEATMETVLLRHHSQTPIRQVHEQDASVGPEIDVFEEHIDVQPLTYPSQSPMRSNIMKELSLGAESAALEESHFMEPLHPASMEPLPPQYHSQSFLKPFTQHQASAFERDVSMDPRLLVHPFQPWLKPQGRQSFTTSESTTFEGDPATEYVPSTLSQPMQQPYQNVPLESEAIAAKKTSMGPLYTKYSTQSLPNPQGQSSSESASIEDATLADLLPPQISVKPKFQPQMTREPVSTATQWGSPMEPISAQHIFQTQDSPKFMQVPTGPDSLEAQESISVHPGSPRCPSNPWMTPTFEQISISPGNVPAAWAVPLFPPASRMSSQPLMGSVVQQPVSTGSMSTSVQQIITEEPMSSRHPLQSWRTSPFEQVSVTSDNAAAAAWGIPIDPPAHRMLSQPLMGSVVKQPVSTELVSIPVPQSSSVELMPSRFSFQSRVDPESYAVKEGVSVMMRPEKPHSQPPKSTGFEEEVSLDSMKASEEWSVPVEPLPPKYSPQSWSGPEFEHQTSCLEGFSQEGDVSKEAWFSRNPSPVTIEHQIQKTPSSFENVSTEEGIPWKPLPSECPTPFLMSSKVQEKSSILESAAAQDSSKKQQNSRSPSQSFVKFMAEQIFSESTANETDISTKPMPRSRSRPSRSLLKPKLEEQASLYNWDDETKEDVTLKNLPMKQPLQTLRRPEEPQEVLSYSGGVPVKWSSSAVDDSQPLGKLEYRQKVSVSVSFPEEWKRSEGQMPSTQPSQAFDEAEMQPPILSSGSANVPVEWSDPEGHQPPCQSTQAFLITDYQQQVYLSSANAAAEGNISPKNTDIWSMPKDQDSPKNTMQYTQGYGDFIKSTPTSVTQPDKLTTVPDKKALISTDTYSNEEVPQSHDEDETLSILSAIKADVENVFGVRLRRISPKSGMENPEPFRQVDPESKEWMNKRDPQDVSRGLEKFGQTVSFAEKQANKPRYEGTFKKPSVYRPPVKTSTWKADYAAEPAWINVAKQRQKGFAHQFPKKPKSRAEIRAVAKEPRYESKYNPDLVIPPKEPKTITDISSRMSFSSAVSRQEMSKSTKSVVFDDQNTSRPYTREKETRRSSSLPPKFLPPEEPVWFSMAKKKSQAWSQMADTMQ